MKNLSFQIVPMKRSHLPDCAKIVASSEPWLTLREGIDFAPSMKRKEAFVCIAGGSVAGFVVFAAGPAFARGGYLRAIGVAPARRKQGIGRKLLRFAETNTALTSPHLFLCVSAFNRQAQSFYRKCGYARVGRIDGLIRENVAEYIFWKRLIPAKASRIRHGR
ncbi:MAG: GNAT family N-acetyltransferase [Nitrospiraceae bacterium]|nr:GNAT family N-acetyltransferase [Nitrospiraceae bacterium]